MTKLKTMKVIEDKLGQILKSALSGESLYYCAHWEEIERQAAWRARKHHLAEPNDVRAADYALDLLGIPNHYTEADQNKKGQWVVYWR
jgi:hypothetical protein